MATRKRLERSLARFWINCKLSWQSQMKCNFWSSVKTCIDWTSFEFRFRNLLSNLLLNIIIYCVTTQPSITRSRRSVLNFQLSVLTFQWPSQRTLCKEKNISTPIYVQCDNLCHSNVCFQAFLYISSGLDIRLDQCKNDKILHMKKIVEGCKIWRFISIFFSIDR